MSVSADVKIVELLTANGANVNLTDFYIFTPLHRTSLCCPQNMTSKFPRVLKLECERVFSIRYFEDCGDSYKPWGKRQCIGLCREDATSLCCWKWFEFKKKNFDNHKFKWIRIILLDYENIVDLLIRNGASVNIEDHSGRTPLHSVATLRSLYRGNS